MRVWNVAVAGLEIDDHTDAQANVTLKLSGELDTGSVSLLENVAERHFSGGAQALTLDLSELMLIDSTGLATVVLVSRLCERDGRELHIIPGPRAVQRLFEITGLVDALPFQDSAQPAS
jgi:anti-anti-sigma factor